MPTRRIRCPTEDRAGPSGPASHCGRARRLDRGQACGCLRIGLRAWVIALMPVPWTAGPKDRSCVAAARADALIKLWSELRRHGLSCGDLLAGAMLTRDVASPGLCSPSTLRRLNLLPRGTRPKAAAHRRPAPPGWRSGRAGCFVSRSFGFGRDKSRGSKGRSPSRGPAMRGFPEPRACLCAAGRRRHCGSEALKL